MLQRLTGGRKAETEPKPLEAPVGSLEERGDYVGDVAESTLYTRLRQRGRTPSGAAFGLGLAGVTYAGYRAMRRRPR
jgi:hypothetical protein